LNSSFNIKTGTVFNGLNRHSKNNFANHTANNSLNVSKEYKKDLNKLNNSYSRAKDHLNTANDALDDAK